MIVVNQVRCKKCGDEPFSRHRHDFVWCKCGAVAVDGGMDYLKRTGDISNVEEMSYSLPDEVVQACIEAVKWGHDTGRNDLGIALAVTRALHKYGRLITGEEVEKQ
jgi:hypothetical protein